MPITSHLPADFASVIQIEGNPLPTFILPRITKGVKVYPGIKDLPVHIRQNFRNEFIRFVVKQVANSEAPWINPDVLTLQNVYQLVYPTFPAQLRHGDAVYHPVSFFLTIALRSSGSDVLLEDDHVAWSPS